MTSFSICQKATKEYKDVRVSMKFVTIFTDFDKNGCKRGVVSNWEATNNRLCEFYMWEWLGEEELVSY